MDIELWSKDGMVHLATPIRIEAGKPMPRIGEEIRLGHFATSKLFKVTGITHEWDRGVVRVYVKSIK